MIESENIGVGPERYNPNWDSVLKVGHTAPMLSKSAIPDRSSDPDEPGPGHYTIPDPFKLPDPRKRASPAEVRQQNDKHPNVHVPSLEEI